MYDILVSVIIGIVQGITEFLPISSTAHNLLVAKFLLGGKDIGLSVSNIFQFGTLVAIIKYFWQDLSVYFGRFFQIMTSPKQLQVFGQNVKKWWSNYESKENHFATDVTLVQLIIATIPVAVVGLLMRGIVDSLRTDIWIGFFLIGGAILMAIADWHYKRTEAKKTLVLSKTQTLIIGLFQAFAVFPGMSRSGSTLSGSFFIGVEKSKAVNFAFLLSIPALGLAGLKDFFSILKDLKNIPIMPNSNVLETGQLSLIGIIIGTFVSYFVGMFCLKWLLRYLSHNTFKVFVIYRLILGIFLLMISGLGK
jgi:undecaprenyl-diphosphatase